MGASLQQPPGMSSRPWGAPTGCRSVLRKPRIHLVGPRIGAADDVVDVGKTQRTEFFRGLLAAAATAAQEGDGGVLRQGLQLGVAIAVEGLERQLHRCDRTLFGRAYI